MNERTENANQESFADVTCASPTAKAFLEKLDETHERWSEGTWVFRGQNDANWDPIPSLFRNNDRGFIDYEFQLISLFVRHINLVNLAVPADTVGFKSYTKDQLPTTLASLSHSSKYGYKYDYTHVVFAIAQHSGIPTRLLDFSYRPHVAAFFSAHNAGLAGKYQNSPDFLEKYYYDILNEYQNSPDDTLALLEKYLQKHREVIDKLPKEIAVWAVRVNELADRTSLRLLDHPYN